MRIAKVFVALTLSGSLAACSGDQQAPTAIRTPQAAIRQRAADTRRRPLTNEESARVASLKGHWQWVADFHHAAMQQLIHDASVVPLRQARSARDRCAIAKRYLLENSPEIEARTGRRHKSAFDRETAIDAMLARNPICGNGGTQAATAAGGVVPLYLRGLVSDIRTATDLADARRIMDSYLVTASADPTVTAAEMGSIAGAIDLAGSSAEEWDAYGRTHQQSLFIWGWLSDLGNWIGDVVSSDLGGCADGLAWAGGYAEYFVLTPDLGADFAGGVCALNGVGWSILAVSGFRVDIQT